MAARRRPRIVIVRADSLKVHPTAQRRMSPDKFRKLCNELDLDGIGVFAVVELDEQLYIIDGQHRWSAIMHHGFGEWLVACEVKPAEDDARASELFLKLNDRTVVAAYDKFVNEVQAGDPVAVGAKETVEGFGLKIDRQVGPGHLVAVASIKRIFAKDDGESVLADTVELATGAWGKTPEAVEGKLLEGLAIVLGSQNGALDRPALTKKLSKYPGRAAGVLADAKGRRKLLKRTLAREVAELVVEIYNSGRRNDQRIALP